MTKLYLLITIISGSFSIFETEGEEMANEVVEKVQKDRVLNNSSDEDGNDENEHSRTAMPHDALFREPESVRGDLIDHHTQSDPYQVSTGFEPTR